MNYDPQEHSTEKTKFFICRSELVAVPLLYCLLKILNEVRHGSLILTNSNILPEL